MVIRSLAALLIALVTSVAPGHAACDPSTDPDASDIANARGAVAANCDCAGATSHRAYVKCAAQQANAVLANPDCVQFVAAGEMGAVSSAARRRTACTTLAITSLRFHPRTVAPGGSATARLRARNCTTQTQSAILTWLGRFRDQGGGLPAGCPVIDPLAQSVEFAARGSFRVHLDFTVPATCNATSLQETARLSGAGGVVFAEQTATLGISRTGP
jgi:hypothetical protein